MGQQTSKSTTPTLDREVNSTEIRFNDPTLLQELLKKIKAGTYAQLQKKRQKTEDTKETVRKEKRQNFIFQKNGKM